jgi:hypothetical protein
MILHSPSIQTAELAFEALLPLGSILRASVGEDEEGADWMSDAAACGLPVDRRWVLTAVVVCRATLDDLEFAAVNEARQHRLSWRQIGSALRVSRHAAEKRWGWIDRADPNLLDDVRSGFPERPRRRRTDRRRFPRM